MVVAALVGGVLLSTLVRRRPTSRQDYDAPPDL